MWKFGAVALLACSPALAADEPAAEPVVVRISGTCRSVMVSGRPSACSRPVGVVYFALPNGRILLNIPLADGRTLAFVAENDRQPKPEEYWMYLSRVRLGTAAETSMATDVGGFCKMLGSASGEIINSVLCEATDSGGNRFALDFRGDGRPVRHSPNRHSPN